MKTKTKILKLSSIAFIALLATGCGSSDSTDSPTPPTESFKSYTINVIDDAVVDATIEAVGCKNSKSLGEGKYTLECSVPPKYISAKGGFVDINNDGKHDDNETSMGLPLLVNLDKNLFDVNLSNIAVTPLSTLVANIKDKSELIALAKQLDIDKEDFNKDISKENKELFQKLNTLLIIAESSGITDQLLLMKKLREQIVLSTESGIGDILTKALKNLENDEDLKKAYGAIFISGFISEANTYMDKSNVLDALSSEYSDNDDTQVFITGFIYDGVITDANIVILDGETKVGEAKSNDKGRWKISIAKTVLETDKVLLFTGTGEDSNGDKILLKSAITTQQLRDIAKKRISASDAIDLIISNVTTSQVALLEKDDKDFLKKPNELEEKKNKIEVFQQNLLLKASAAIKAIIDGNSKISQKENTYSFIFDNLFFKDDSKDEIILELDGKISDEALEEQIIEIKKDAILSQQLLTIESEKVLTSILDKSLYTVEYSGTKLTKKYKKSVVSSNKLIETNYILEEKQWKKVSTKEYTGKIHNNVFYFDTNKSVAPYAISLKDNENVHSIELNKDYTFDILGKQLYLPYQNQDTTKVGINIYAESFDIVTVFKEVEESKIVKALGEGYSKLSTEEQNLAVSRYLIAKVTEKPKPFDKTNTKLTSAIDTLKDMDTETDDIDAKLATVKSILNGAEANDNDAQVGKALFSLAEITNSPTLGKLIDLELDGSTIGLNDNLATLLKDDDDKLEATLLTTVTDLSEISMELVHETVLKLQDINSTLGINFADEQYTFSYDDFNITNNQAKLLRVGVLSVASQLEYMTAFNYITIEDAKIRTTVLNGVSSEYSNVSADPLSVFKRSDVGSLNTTIGTERLANSKALLLEALDVLDSVVASKEDSDEEQSILDAQKEIAKLRASLNGTSLYQTEDEDYGVTTITHIDLSALYSASTALDLTHTMGHNFVYDTEYYYYDYSTQKGYTSGNYNQEFSRFYNEAMAKEWVAEDGSKVAYINGSMDRPYLELEPKTVPTGSNSHIPSIVKKIEIKESGEFTIIHTGDNVLKYMFNTLDVERDHSKSSSSSITYYIDNEDNLIPDTTVRYGVDIRYGNVELINADPVKGEVTVQLKSGFTGSQSFALDVYDTLGHNEVVYGYLDSGERK